MSQLFDYTNFIPHGFCLSWDVNLLTTMIIANLGIGLVYWIIPVQLLYFKERILRRVTVTNLPVWIPVAFGIFIFLCGTSHFVKVYTLFVPNYWLEAYIDFATMTSSILTSVFFGLALRHMLSNLLFSR